ncbi:AAA family ATPase [Anaerobranca gottschalkii]|uniref:ATP-dependent metalloprotease FtsH n=1 Tax=Anaerobranca gottschalkii DSM 13577 TaxID=1120990 RepID=A0A1H9Z9N6_9FIRM|nr:AAA family ATPase [Anaerobranca gottschalkii]SES77576.1 ATP-dependent metalloprotease FtsH [Anaerobranca gottschalkii DSM 13577]
MVIKELTIGTLLTIIIILLIKGVNIFPFVLLAAVGLFLVYRNQIADFIESTIESPKNEKILTIDFDQIGGQETAKKELLEALEFVVNKDLVKKLGIRPLKGIILQGPPGTGKTLLAKAAAKYTNSAFIATSGSEFVEMYAGVGAKRVRKLFADAKRLALKEKKNSAVIFIDEIDVLGVKRGSNSSHMEYDQTLNQLLVEMDGLKSSDIQILVMAATNRLDLLDDALLRPGRFDRIVNIPLPSKWGRLEILRIHTKNKPLGDDVDLEKVAAQTFGFSGAHLENVTNEAAILALRNNRLTITQQDFLNAIEKVIMGEKIDRVPTKEELKRIAIHEVGHGFISELYRPNSVASITVAPRGQALGYMRQVNSENLLETKESLLKTIAVTVAGAMAEKVFFDQFSTGATNDFNQAISLAKKIIDCGLSDLGTTNCNILPKEVLNKEITTIIENVKIETEKILLNKKGLIEKLANYLLENETISGDEFRNIIQGL